MAHVRERPPLRTSIEVETPSGKRYRWAENEPQPENVPSGVRWSDTMPGGFESMDCVLPRKSGVDYSDLEQLSTLRVRGASGDIAGEYRLERSPRTSGEQMAISPGAVGLQAHLEDDKSATIAYIDRDLSHWRETSLTRQSNLTFNAIVYSALTVGPGSGADQPHIMLGIRGPWDGASGFRSEAHYDAPMGDRISRVYTDWGTTTNIGTGAGNWFFQAYATDDEAVSFPENSADQLTGAATSGNLDFVPGTPRKQAMLQLGYTTAAGSEIDYVLGAGRVSVYGNHNLVRQGSNGDTWGFLASQMVAHAVGRWAPLLNITPESVQPSGFVVPHLAFLEPTTAGEIVRQATRFGLQDWGVWDNKTFWWHNRGAFSKRWRARVAPAQLDETGPQVDRLWESIIVSYNDVDGSTRTVGPLGSGANTEDASLKDDDPDNPANQLGIVRRDVLQMGTSTPAGATEVGRRFLEASKELDRSGRAQLVGHVEDDHGVVHPYWRPRAGDYISFVDASDPSYRRIVRTDKDHSTRTCSLDLDAPPEGLQALLERLGVGLVPLGIS